MPEEENEKEFPEIEKGGVKKPKRIFPRVTLQEVLAVPRKIKELNGGNLWDPAQLASAFDLGIKAN